MSKQAIEDAKDQVKKGSEQLALETLSQALNITPESPELYRAASQIILQSSHQTDTLSKWPGFEAFVRLLLRHHPCHDPLPIFAHEAASAITSGNVEAVKNLLSLLSGILPEELENAPNGSKEQTAVLVFALTTRSFAGSWLDQKRLSKLHSKCFSSFTVSERALPYSTMFSPEHFGQNAADLFATYFKSDQARQIKDLKPDQILFLDWLLEKAIFADTDVLNQYLDRHLPGTKEATESAKALLLRYGNATSEEKLAAWGISNPVVGSMAFQGAKTITKQGRQKSNLQKKSYQVRNAALNTYTPFLAKRNRPKIAICLSGQLRGYEKALQSWRTTFLPFVDPTFFIHSWKNIGRSQAQPFRYILPFEGEIFSKVYREIASAIGYDEMQTRYPSLFLALTEGSEISESRLKDLYETEHVILEDDQAVKFDDFSNQQKMHYKIFAADKLAREHTEQDFDLYMRLRPDLSMSVLGFDWNDLLKACRSRPLIFAEKPYGMHYGNLMCGDQCAVSTSDTLEIYANTWETYPYLAKANVGNCPADFEGHISLAMTCWTNGIDVERIPIRFGLLNEAAPLSTKAIVEAIVNDNRGDKDDLRLLDAAQKDLSRNT